jgi:hypothetical protein
MYVCVCACARTFRTCACACVHMGVCLFLLDIRLALKHHLHVCVNARLTACPQQFHCMLKMTTHITYNPCTHQHKYSHTKINYTCAFRRTSPFSGSSKPSYVHTYIHSYTQKNTHPHIQENKHTCAFCHASPFSGSSRPSAARALAGQPAPSRAVSFLPSAGARALAAPLWLPVKRCMHIIYIYIRIYTCIHIFIHEHTYKMYMHRCVYM